MSAAGASNTFVYAEDWAEKLQERLSEPTKWKEICDVQYTKFRTLNNPYLTNPTVQTGTRGCQYNHQDITDTNETLTISTFRILPQFIDRADLAQSRYPQQMELADRQGVLLNEAIETVVFADYGNWTVLDASDASLGGGAAGSVSLSATNVDDVIRAVKRKIRVAGGETLLDRNGGFIVWRPADLEILEQFMQANGFGSADQYLKEGPSGYKGVFYMGLWHYSSNLLSGGHIYAGVKQLQTLGILRSTYGQVMVNPYDPNATSGISVVSRVDIGVKSWNNYKTCQFDVRLA